MFFYLAWQITALLIQYLLAYIFFHWYHIILLRPLPFQNTRGSSAESTDISVYHFNPTNLLQMEKSNIISCYVLLWLP